VKLPRYKRAKLAYLLLFSALASLFTCGDLSASFETLDLGGKAAGMGQAFTAISDDVTGIYYNPAGMTQLRQAQLLTDYSRLFMGLADQSELGYSFIGYIHPLRSREGKLGVGWLNFNTAGLYTENTFLLSYAQEIRPLFSVGLNLKLLEKSCYPRLVLERHFSFAKSTILLPKKGLISRFVHDVP